MKRIILPDAVSNIINMLEAAGFRADAVGGAVRDALLGRVPSDYDVTTSALPEQTRRVFDGWRVIETGLKHGTLTVLCGGEPYEITTYRIDGEYTDSRRPDTVSFTESLEEDLARRDFTVNAMAYSEKHGLTDPFGGEADLGAGIIRTVGDAERRFTEDALRIMRAVRFSSALGFTVEDKTAAAIHSLKERLLLVSAERIFVEWRKLLAGFRSYEALAEYKDVILLLIPELSPLALPDKKLWDSLSEREREIALFALNSDGVGFECAMRRLKSDRARMVFGRSVLEGLSQLPSAKREAVAEFLVKNEDDVALTALRLGAAFGECGEAYSLAEKMISEDIPRRIQMLAVGGNDLIEIGIRGEAIGKVLSDLLLAVARGECGNSRAALLSLAEKRRK